MEDNLKVCFTGPSGSGKTTLAKEIAKEFNLNFISGSSLDIKSKEMQDHLKQKYSHLGNLEGHKNIIKASAMDKDFAYENQELIRESRERLLINNNNFVTDRSPIDNFAYFVNQCGFQEDDVKTKVFFDRCSKMLNQITHLILVRSPGIKYVVEDNKSRVNNKYYQNLLIDPLFNEVFHLFISEVEPEYLPRVFVINFWDWEMRLSRTKEFLKS